jgi:phosphatidylinositol alpha-1,6-mannosyltransferase
VDDATLASAYRESDLLIFPVLDLPGDVEGIGMVAVEAAAHGLLTVAFAAGGVPDAVKEGVSGYLVVPGDYVSLTDTIVRCLSEKSSTWSGRCIAHAKNFSWDLYGGRAVPDMSWCGQVAE